MAEARTGSGWFVLLDLPQLFEGGEHQELAE